MRIGLSIPSSQPWGDRAAVTAVAQEADRSGFDSVWTADHLLAPLGDLDEVGFERSRYQWMTGRPADTQRVTPQQYYGSNNWFLEGYSVMAYLAGVTERVRIGSSVVVLPYRNPIVQARAVQTIDVLSGGRISLGVGAGHVRAESEALGVPYNERAAMTEEYIRVMRAIWAGDTASFHGRYFDFDEALTLGRTVQQPPPIYYGGMAKAAIRRAVRLCDGWLASPAPMEPEQFKAGVDFAREEARRIGRAEPFEVIYIHTGRLEEPDERIRARWSEERMGASYDFPRNYSADELADRLRRYERAGVDEVVVGFFSVDAEMNLRQARAFAEKVMPQLR